MTKNIPIFPLNLVAFPGELLNLHIFEPRYRELVKDCLENDLSFGIVPVSDKKLASIGTEMDIVEIVHAYPDGKMDIKTRGLNAFRLLSFQEKMIDKLYPGGEIEALDEIMNPDLVLQSKIFKLVQKLYSSMNMKVSLPKPSEDYYVFEIAHKIGLNTEQEIDLLRMRSEFERLIYVHEYLENLIPIVTQMEDLRNKVRMNGHFKDALPPDFEL